jgi:hypothetical protein
MNDIQAARAKLKIPGYQHPSEHVNYDNSGYRRVGHIVEDIKSCTGDGCIKIEQRRDVPNIVNESKQMLGNSSRRLGNPYKTTGSIMSQIEPVTNKIVEEEDNENKQEPVDMHIAVSDVCIPGNPCQHAVSINGSPSKLLKSYDIIAMLNYKNIPIPEHFQ